MIKKSIVLKFAMVLILLEACSLTAPITNTLQSSQPNNPPGAATAASNSSDSAALAAARQNIKHIVIIMQENRSFDSYFGTYPGADGIPAQNGKFTVCVNDPNTGQCVVP